MDIVLAILYAPEGQKPLSIARVYDRNLLSVAAEHAISEAEATAQQLMEADPILGTLQQEETLRLRRVLAMLLQPQIASLCPQ